MSHAVGIEHGVPKAVFQDARTRRFTCRVDSVGNLEIGTQTARPELVLDDGSAEFLEGVLRAYRTTRTLSDPGPSRDALAAAVEDLAARIDEIDGRLRAAMKAIGWLLEKNDGLGRWDG